jgi:signal transduction histidine kinase
VSDKPNDDRDAFGAITAVAHELRTPLTAIQGAVEILRDGTAGALSPAQQEFANLAHRNLARLRDRIEDALDIARLKSEAASEPAAIVLEELADCVAKRTEVESSPELGVRFEGFRGDLQLAIQDRSVCRTLASIVGTVGRHLGKGVVIVRATVEQSRIRFEVAADHPAGEGRGSTEIHDSGLALACEMVEVHGGSLSRLETGCCGVYVLLPLWPICAQEER